MELGDAWDSYMVLHCLSTTILKFNLFVIIFGLYGKYDLVTKEGWYTAAVLQPGVSVYRCLYEKRICQINQRFIIM